MEMSERKKGLRKCKRKIYERKSCGMWENEIKAIC
jgi:hypothetical protein